MDSILDSVKKNLGIPLEVTDFDQDIILLINSAFGTLHQIGLGPIDGFEIEDNTAVWDSFTLGDKRYNGVKQYVYLKVRVVFDPPQQSYVLEALNQSITELTWRLNVARENDVLNYPNPTVPTFIFDGGAP